MLYVERFACLLSNEMGRENVRDDAIILRPAQVSDAKEIWHLIHAEGKGCSIDRILQEIDRIYVLTYRKRYLGVLCGTFTPGRETVSWVAVHPMYPESSLKTAMIKGLWGVLCRRPYRDREWEQRKELSFIKWLRARALESFLPLFKTRV